MRIRPARGPIAWYLRTLGYAGITLPPAGIYILPHRLDDVRLRRHEMEHWRQYRERGVVRFYVGYLWLLWRHGYWLHPWERAAREAETRSDPVRPPG